MQIWGQWMPPCPCVSVPALTRTEWNGPLVPQNASLAFRFTPWKIPWNPIFKVKCFLRWSKCREQLQSPVCKAVQRGCCLSPSSLLVQLRPALHLLDHSISRPVVHSDIFGSTTFAGGPQSGIRVFADYPYELILVDFILLLFRVVCFAAYQWLS